MAGKLLEAVLMARDEQQIVLGPELSGKLGADSAGCPGDNDECS